MYKTSIYLAAPFEYRHVLRPIADELTREGFVVTSKWIYLDAGMETATDEENATFARLDLHAIDECDIMISITGQGGRGGRHVEFGYGYATGCKLWLVGPREVVFHYLEDVVQFNDWAEIEQCLNDRCGTNLKLVVPA